MRIGSLKILASAAVAAALMCGTAHAQAIAPGTPDAKLYEMAKAEGGTLVWYHSGPADPMREFANAFEKRYPGIRVEITRVVGPRMYQRFTQESKARQYIADVVHISDRPAMSDMIRMGLMAEWKVAEDKLFKDTFKLQGHAYAGYLSDNVIAYNTNRVTPEEVELLRKSWKSVLDPRFKGRFAVSPLACGICYSAVQMFLEEKDYGPDFLRKVAEQKPKIYPSTVVGLDRVVAGEADFIFWSFESAVMSHWMAGAPVRWVHPEPTPIFPNSWQAVSANAPHPATARLFQNFTFSQEGARVMQKTVAAPTTIDGVPDERAVTKEPWYDPIKRVFQIKFDRWDKQFDADMKVWQDALKRAQ